MTNKLFEFASYTTTDVCLSRFSEFPLSNSEKKITNVIKAETIEKGAESTNNDHIKSN